MIDFKSGLYFTASYFNRGLACAAFCCLFLSVYTVHSKHIYVLAGPSFGSDSGVSGDPR